MSSLLLPDLLASLLAQASAIEVDGGSPALPGAPADEGPGPGERPLSICRIELSLPAYLRPGTGQALGLTLPGRNALFEKSALLGRVTIGLVPTRG